MILVGELRAVIYFLVEAAKFRLNVLANVQHSFVLLC